MTYLGWWMTRGTLVLLWRKPDGRVWTVRLTPASAAPANR